jgi:hypothetical protein
MKLSRWGALGPAAATFALLLAAGCSQAPPPTTQPARTARSAADPSGTAPAAAKKAAATPATTAKAPAPHSSEAEPKAAPATASAAGAASAPGGPASPATSPAPPTSPTPPIAAAQKPAAAPGDPSVVVVDQPDYDPSSQLTLAQAAKAERERKAEAVPPRIVINNKNLHRYAKGGQLTVADPKKKKQDATPAAAASASTAAAPATARPAAGGGAAGTAATAGGAGSPGFERDERYWRGRALDIRERWHNAAERVKGLEQDVSEWRRRFYAQDDPWVRDGQIKPAWDHALEELRASRAAVVSAKKELVEFQEEGRIAGALPGWLREGIDLEPKEEPPVDPAQGIETPIYKEPGPPR